MPFAVASQHQRPVVFRKLLQSLLSIHHFSALPLFLLLLFPVQVLFLPPLPVPPLFEDQENVCKIAQTLFRTCEECYSVLPCKVRHRSWQSSARYSSSTQQTRQNPGRYKQIFFDPQQHSLQLCYCIGDRGSCPSPPC